MCALSPLHCMLGTLSWSGLLLEETRGPRLRLVFSQQWSVTRRRAWQKAEWQLPNCLLCSPSRSLARVVQTVAGYIGA